MGIVEVYADNQDVYSVFAYKSKDDAILNIVIDYNTKIGKYLLNKKRLYWAKLEVIKHGS